MLENKRKHPFTVTINKKNLRQILNLLDLLNIQFQKKWTSNKVYVKTKLTESHWMYERGFPFSL